MNSLLDEIFEKVKKVDDSFKMINGELYPFQKEGVQFLARNNGNAILSFSMGMGKSITALAYSNSQGFKKILVICPASVKYSWQNEVLKWTRYVPVVIGPKTKFTKEIYENGNVFIINYDILKRFLSELLAFKFEHSIIDECQYIKNNSSIRCKATKMIVKFIPSKTLMSGTPILSRPVEVYNALNIIDPSTWNNWKSFTERYCNAYESRFGWDASGASNIKELQERISKYFLRKTKEEVLKDLPPKINIDYPVEMEKKYVDAYVMAMDSFEKFLMNVKKKSALSVKNTMQAEKLVKIGELRQITTLAKIGACADLIDSILESGEKVLVFSCYNDPLRILNQRYKNSVLLLGDSTAEKRKEIINEFQTNDDVKIMFGGIKSAGIGITLTAATNVIFIDYSWVPADHDQAETRAHRIGTTKPVNVYQMYCRGTIDEYMRRLLLKKRVIVDNVVGGEYDRSDESIVVELVNLIENGMSKYMNSYAKN